jgi:mono/diheme cytochrome c family protein
MAKNIFGRLLLAGVAAAAAMIPVLAQQQKPPRLVLDSMAGADLYRFYCASCHGADGKGRGPVAAALIALPADLTTVAERNGGRFPRAKIAAFVSSGDLAIAAHGSQGMPVWGPIFRGLDPSAARTTMRIDNLVTYLESLQEK